MRREWELNNEGDVPFSVKKEQEGADPEDLGQMSPEASEATVAIDGLAKRAGGNFKSEVINNPGLFEAIVDKVAENKLFAVSAVLVVASIIISGEINNVMSQADVYINSFPSYEAPPGGLIRGMETSHGMMDFYSGIDGVMGFYDKVQGLKNIRIVTAAAGALAAVGGVAQKMGVGGNINKTK